MPASLVSGADSRRGAVGGVLSIFHSTESDIAPSVTVAFSVCVPAVRFSFSRSRLRLLVGLATVTPLIDHVTGRTRSAGWFVST